MPAHACPAAAHPVLDGFSGPTREWFRSSFPAPTAAQVGAWEAISAGHHALVVAPTGSGKTLSAFLWAIDQQLRTDEPAEKPEAPSTSILYVSPLKALASDVERNLSSPLVGISHAANRIGEQVRLVRIGTRTGDTPPAERRAFAKNPPEILITTPESLYLLLTSKARSALAGVHTVIIDEIHTMVGNKRGAHLGLSLERLDELTASPVQRIGLSATVNPIERVAAFLSGARTPDAGGRTTVTVTPPSEKKWDLRVTVPLEDMSELGQPTADLTGLAAGSTPTASIWPHIEADIITRIDPRTHPDQSTLVFTNARRTAERLTSRINEAWTAKVNRAGELTGDEESAAERNEFAPSEDDSDDVIEIARAHHGSVSKEQRTLIEEALKVGSLPAVVSTSSLELGIDMGAIDQVLQISPPPSVAAGLQRVGRAGHQVGAVSRGVVYPKHRSEVLPAALITECMLAGELEPLHELANPLDVLAQQIVAMCAVDEWKVDDLLACVRRASNFNTLTATVFDALLDMLAGRYPSTEFAELKPRIVWDRATGTVTGRPAAQRLAVTSGGTIPDRGLFGVFLAGSEGAGRRVGELDEEMVYESRVGDVFTLGSSSWRIEDITHDQVLVTPAPGQPGKLPFWRGDALGRPAELGRKLGALYRELEDAEGGVGGDAARARLSAAGLDTNAVENAVQYLTEQREATGALPTDHRLVLERFRDELGDWRIVLHSPFGMTVHSPWALAVSRTLGERFGIDVQAMPHDDGIVIRLPDMMTDGDFSNGLDAFGEPVAAVGFDGEPRTADAESAPGSPIRDLLDDVTDTLLADPETIEMMVTETVTGSALFASRFRECAARALLLPRRNPTRRQPLWQQRQRASQLLDVASKYPTFPIMLETARECTHDVFDIDALTRVLRDINSGAITIAHVTTSNASPFAGSLLFGYVAQFLYEGDSPAAERRAAALALDPELLADLLGRSDGTTLADLLEPQAVLDTHNGAQRLSEDRHARNAEGVADMLRALGPLTAAEVTARSATDDATPWCVQLVQAGRAITATLGTRDVYASAEDAGMLRDALGVPLPPGLPAAFGDSPPDPWGELVARYARTRGPFSVAAVAEHFGVGRAVAADCLRRLADRGGVVTGELLPASLIGVLEGNGNSNIAAGPYFCDAGVMRLLRRRSLAALRAEVEPVDQSTYAGFLAPWQHVRTSSGGLRGAEGVLTVVETLVGARVPASAVESLILPARVRDYQPGMLDELCAAGEVMWCGHGSLGGKDGWVSLHLAESVELTRPLTDPDVELSATARSIIDLLARGGGFYGRDIAAALRESSLAATASDIAAAVWEAVWAGYVTSDTIAPLRALVVAGGTHKSRSAPRPRRYRTTSRSGLRGLAGASAGALPAHVSGRWSLLPPASTDATLRAHAAAEVMLERYGVVTRGSVMAEDIPGGFAAVYKVLAAKEEAGHVRRGYFIDGLGASQFATAGAVDRLRTDEPAPMLVLAATDPANPFGASLNWPESDGKHRPARRGGATVVIAQGRCAAYMERGAKSLLVFEPDLAAEVARALSGLVEVGRLKTLTVHHINGESALADDVKDLRDTFSENGFHVIPRGLRCRR